MADVVGCSYETAYKKLREIEDAGTIESKRVGNARLCSFRRTSHARMRQLRRVRH